MVVSTDHRSENRFLPVGRGELVENRSRNSSRSDRPGGDRVIDQNSPGINLTSGRIEYFDFDQRNLFIPRPFLVVGVAAERPFQGGPPTLIPHLADVPAPYLARSKLKSAGFTSGEIDRCSFNRGNFLISRPFSVVEVADGSPPQGGPLTWIPASDRAWVRSRPGSEYPSRTAKPDRLVGRPRGVRFEWLRWRWNQHEK